MNVPYLEKEEAKPFGAKYNWAGKFWYCDELNENLMRWYDGPELPDNNERHREALEEEQSTIIIGDGSTIDLQQYMSVSDACNMIEGKYNEIPEFRRIMVKGEVTNYSGHTRNYYFSIKDNNAVLHCFMWESTAASALNFELATGQQVAIIGSMNLYKAGGKSQILVNRIVNVGDGAAMLAYIQLKERLEAEGLFDADHKKEIPRYPKQVGILTSKSGQAIKDICKVAGKRNPYVQLVLYHVNVQGQNAVRTILEGISYMDGQGFDTIIIGRGGGSDEELMAYNSEEIARAVYNANTPIVSAVGHEGHWTLIDYVADKRVATPSEAAEESVPDVMTNVNRVLHLKKSIQVIMLNHLEQKKHILNERKAELEKNSPERKLKEQQLKLEAMTRQLSDNMVRIAKDRNNRLAQLSERLNNNMARIAEDSRNRLSQLSERINNNMTRIAIDKRNRFDQLWERLDQNMLSIYKNKRHRYELLVEKLNGLSPTAKLVRGFGYISHEDRPVTTVEDVQIGDAVVMRIHDGEIDAAVTDIRKRRRS